MNDYYVIKDGELYHSGIKGMKWGVRRFQNTDGSLTPAGRKRYSNVLEKDLAKTKKKLDKATNPKKVAKLERKVDRLSKADPKAYETLKKNQANFKVQLGLLGGIKVYGYAKSPKGQAKIKAGKKIVQNIIDSQFNASILDPSGKVLRYYNM